MSLIDVVQLVSVSTTLFALASWLIKMRALPLTIAVVVAMCVNVFFFLARTFNWLSPLDLNLISALRVLLLTGIIAAIPWTLGKHL
jgi:hypothetical protein